MYRLIEHTKSRRRVGQGERPGAAACDDGNAGEVEKLMTSSTPHKRSGRSIPPWSTLLPTNGSDAACDRGIQIHHPNQRRGHHSSLPQQQQQEDLRQSLRRLSISSSGHEVELIATSPASGEGGDLLILPTFGRGVGLETSREFVVDDISSTDSSLSTVDDLQSTDAEDEPSSPNDEQILVFDEQGQDITDRLDDDHVAQQASGGKRRFTLVRISPRRRNLLKEVDVDKYMSNREMTSLQEVFNAITMLPSPIYCLYFCLSGQWVDRTMVEEVRQDLAYSANSPSNGGFAGFANDMVGDENGCLSRAWWHNMPALPPLTVLAVAVAITAHAPFSMLYHYKYARALPPGAARTTHWSRRMDHSMIHFASALMAYSSSGSWDFFVANLLYNADCIYRQFKHKVRPRRNKVRVLISVMAYTVPILRRGDWSLFLQLWLVLGFSFWLFGTYPIGGWSHSAFHLAIALAPPLMMTAACTLPASQEQMQLAAQCVATTSGRR